MKAYDFQYGEHNLQDFGMILCKFDSGGLDTISDGSEITFNTIPVQNGAKSELVSTVYENNLETTLQICKHSCTGDIQEITASEHRELTRWLSRKKFLKLKILDEDHIDLYYEAIINVSKIELDGKIYGLELSVVTNRPFALKEPKTITIRSTEVDSKHSINDTSYEEGYIYPHIEITINQSGNLNIHNAIEGRNTYIANCIANEVITMDYPVIESNNETHNKTLQNDFNWNFFRVANTYENSRNDLTISLPCTIKIKYSPIVKVGM